VVLLKYVPPDYFAEFFMDYVLRKFMAKPHEYVRFMPSVKYFYRFLSEKGYEVKKYDEVLNLLNVMEVHFLKKLRERFC
jgi:hypothetical protein